MVLALLGYFFSMVAVLAAAVGVMIGFSNASMTCFRIFGPSIS
jgi:hypothetical protein